MKQKLLTFMLLVFGAVLGVQAEDFVYQNDFSSTEGLTIVGGGSFADNDRFGKVFQNVGTAVRSNYLLLPEDLLAHSAETKALTIGFWVSAEGYTPDQYTYSPFFTAYAAKAETNSWPMLALQSRGFAQVNCVGWCDFTGADNVAGKNTAYNASCWEATNVDYLNGGSWLEDQKWHFYTAVFTETNLKIYLDGEVKNEWSVDGSDGHYIGGLFSNGADLKYICLGGNQAWAWNDNDGPFAFANFYLSNKALTSEQVVAQMEASKAKTSEPAITFEATAGLERSITVGLNAAGTVKVDWGDGTLVEQTAAGAYDGWDNALEFTGTPSGTVKVYGEGINYFQAFTKYEGDALPGGITSIDLSNAPDITELDLHQNKLSSVDLSALTELTSLTIGVNDFETIDLSANTKLTKIDLSDGKNNGKLTSIDLSKNTKLTNVVLSGNKLATLDLSNNPLVKTLTVLNNELTSVTFGENTTSKHTINLGGNKLTSIDLSGFTTYSSSYLRLRDNELSEIILPGQISQLWADGNALTLSQLYALKSQAKTLTYATTFTKPEAQQPMEITADGSVVDLSSEALLGESATVFVWKTSDGTALVEGTDYTVENGVFTFLTDQTDIHCEMTNAELPLFTADKPFKTTAVSVVGGGSGGGGEEAGTPAITFEAGAAERTITIGLNAAGTVKVDWGDGTLVEQTAAAAYDGWDNALEFTGTPSGTVKVYGEGITYFQAFTKITDGAIVNGITSIDLSNAPDITELDLHQNNLTTVDLSALTALEKLTIGVNDFETIDLSANTALTSLDANATTTIEGKLTSLDLSKNTALTTLKANYNKISSIDLSNNTSLKNIYLLNNGLTSVDFGENTTAKIYISLNNNNLQSLDVTALTGLSTGTLFAMNNNLTELKHGAVKALNVTGNKLDLPGLYEVIQDVTTPTYASEQDYEIPATIDGSIDLSSQSTVNGEASTIVWKTESGTVLEENVDYTVENGVYTFISEQTEKVYAEMSNPAALPKLITPIKTTLATVIASGEAGEVDASALLAEIEEAKKLLKYSMSYYDEHNEETPDTEGKSLVDAIRDAETQAETAATQNKVDKTLDALKQAELDYANAAMEYELAESGAILAAADPETDELAAELERLYNTQDVVREDYSNQPKNIKNYADELDKAQKAYLRKALNELIPQAQAVAADNAELQKAIEAAKDAAEGDSSEEMFEALQNLQTAVDSAMGEMTPLDGDVATFEDLTLEPESFWQGIYEEERDEDEIGICYNTFKSGSFQFDNYYSPDYGGYWGNFAYSNQTSTSYESLADQFHAITGGGHESATFGVAFPQGGSVTYMDNAEGTVIPGFYITNSAYAYTSMLNGDAYAKKFVKGDWFKLTITGLDADGNETGTKEFYLADLRDEDSSKHFIVNDWRYVDLSGLGKVKSLKFILDSSDKGSWGINTPGYFCIDDFGANGIETQSAGNIPTAISGVAVYDNATDAPVYNLNGQRVSGNAKGIVIKNGKKVIVK